MNEVSTKAVIKELATWLGEQAELAVLKRGIATSKGDSILVSFNDGKAQAYIATITKLNELLDTGDES